MLKTYDTYIELLIEILKTLKDYYVRPEGSVNCSDVKKVVDTTIWFDKIKKLLIRFQAFIRGTTFMQFRLLFKQFFIIVDSDKSLLQSGVKEFLPTDYSFEQKNITMNELTNINNSFELWTEIFNSTNVNRTSVTSASFKGEEACSGPSFFDSDTTGVSGGINSSNPFYGMSYDDIDLFQDTQISALKTEDDALEELSPPLTP